MWLMASFILNKFGSLSSATPEPSLLEVELEDVTNDHEANAQPTPVWSIEFKDDIEKFVALKQETCYLKSFDFAAYIKKVSLCCT